MRAPFQVLVLPYRKTPSGFKYAILRQSGSGYWEFVSGGGEDTEKPFEAAKREIEEDIGIIAEDVNLMPLDSLRTQPKSDFSDSYASSWALTYMSYLNIVSQLILEEINSFFLMSTLNTSGLIMVVPKRNYNGIAMRMHCGN